MKKYLLIISTLLLTTVILPAQTGVIGPVPSNVSPINSVTTHDAAYTFVLADANTTIYHSEATTARTYTIPANSSVAYPVGTVICIYNGAGTGNITLAITTDTLSRADGTAGTGSRTITADSAVSITKITSTLWIIQGKFS